jgi:hypothetical protein
MKWEGSRKRDDIFGMRKPRDKKIAILIKKL